MTKNGYSTQYTTDDRLEQRWTQIISIGKQTPGVLANQNPLNSPPKWFDEQRLINAQKIVKPYLFSLNIAHFIGNILLVLLPEVLVPIAATGTSGNAYRVLLRVLSTVVHINSWYEGNPFDKTSRIYASLRQVRCGCHLQVTQLLNQKYPNEKQVHPFLEGHNLWLSQYDMAMTQWSLIGIFGSLPDNCGFYISDCLDKCREETLKLQNTLSENDPFPILVAKQTANGFQVYLQFTKSNLMNDEQNERLTLCSQIQPHEAKLLYVLQESMYLWRVLGYSMGVHDDFNVAGEECIARNVTFLRMCLDRGYRPVLEKPNELVNVGLRLVRGMFLALSCIVPGWLITYEGFMKYWYEALKFPHEFRLRNFAHKFSYVLTVLVFDWMLRVQILFRIWSVLFFWLLEKLLQQVRESERLVQQKYGNQVYQVLDSNGNPFTIENKGYKSNV